MKKVLIAIDYNPSAQKVVEAGYALAKALDAQVCLLHVISDAGYYTVDYSPFMGYGGFNTASSLQLVEELKSEAKKFLETTARHLNDEDIETEVSEGDVADAILEWANEYGSDLIVMGSHSRSGFEKLLMGDNTAKVLRHSTIPLLIIPNKEPAA